MQYIEFEKERKYDVIFLGRVAIDFNPAYSDAVKEEFKPLKRCIILRSLSADHRLISLAE